MGSDTSYVGSLFGFIMFGNDDSPVTAKLTTPDGQQYTQNISTSGTYPILGGGLIVTILYL